MVEASPISKSARAAETRFASTKTMMHMCFGGLAGCSAKTFVAPLERVRILAQTGTAGQHGMGAMCRRVVEREGVAGLWRGNGVNCMRVFPSKAVLFSTNDFWKSVLSAMVAPGGGGGGSGVQRIGVTFAAGSLAGLTSVMVTYPLDFLRTQVAGRVNEQGQLWRIVRDTVRTDGVRALYRGSTLSLAGALPYEGIKFCTFDAAQRFVEQRRSGAGSRANSSADPNAPPRVGVVTKLWCGALAGTAAGFIMYPNDTVRKRMQVEPAGTFRGAVHCYTETFRDGGVRRFYRGLAPYLVRMVPNSMIQFATYEWLKASWVEGG